MKRKALLTITVALIVGFICGSFIFFSKYRIADTMTIPIKEFSTAEYPEDPAHHSIHRDQYRGRQLTLVKKDDTHFDFIFESQNPNIATVAFRDIDLSLFIPIEPQWTKNDSNLEVIALVDREWNRQQVRFNKHSPNLEVSGGNGFEKANLFSAELASNCLNAGLWEVLLFTQEDGKKALYTIQVEDLEF